MKVAIDSGPLTSGDSVRGIGIHTRELINHLQKFKDLKIDALDFSKINPANYDILHYPSFHPHILTLPLSADRQTKIVVTIHDLIRLIYPRNYPPGLKGQIIFFLQKIGLKNVDAVITISETSKKDIIRFLGIPQEKIFVIYLAPQSKFSKTTKGIDEIKEKYNLPDKFVLYIGDVNFNKNLLNLAKACELSKIKLVIVGKSSVGKVSDNIENKPWKIFLKKYEESKNVIRLGFLDGEEFEAIFKLASLYCQPSLYEGFGLQLLECFERGLPVVASKTQALVEIGKDACFYVDPKSPMEISTGINKVLNDKNLRKDLINKGRIRSKDFSWDKAAKETYEVYKKVYSEK